MNDPKHKLYLKDTLQKFIYMPTFIQIQKRLNAIALSHAIDDRHGSKTFLYKGEVYSSSDYRSHFKPSLLTRRLHPMMDEWIADNNAFIKESEIVSNYLTCVLNHAYNMHDVLALLPECLWPAFKLTNLNTKMSSLTPAQIEAVMTVNSSSIQTIKERLVHNMLM
jgi:hypothetical protein